MELKDKVALVTGASRGIGKAIATALAAQGATVVGTATTQSGAQALHEWLSATGGRGVALDVNDTEAVIALVDGLIKSYQAPIF